MRKVFSLVLVLAACAGPDADPVDVAERFHASRAAGNDRGLHALLTDADRAAVPLEAFPTGLPGRLATELLGHRDNRLDSASLLSVDADTAAVVLHLSRGVTDTVRLTATHESRRLWRMELDRVRWRVSWELTERARLDSLAAPLRGNGDARDPTAVEQATVYLEAAERRPALARAADMEAARSLLRNAAVLEALRIELSVTESFTGARHVHGRIQNPGGSRIATVRLIVRDVAGTEDVVELWDIPAGGTASVSQLTRLARGPLTHRLERLQVY